MLVSMVTGRGMDAPSLSTSSSQYSCWGQFALLSSWHSAGAGAWAGRASCCREDTSVSENRHAVGDVVTDSGFMQLQLVSDGCCSSHLLSGVSHSKPRLSEGPVGLHVAIATSQRQRWLGHDVCRQPDVRMLSGFTVWTWRRVSELLFIVLLFRKLNWGRNLRYYSNTDLSVNNIFYSDISFY